MAEHSLIGTVFQWDIVPRHRTDLGEKLLIWKLIHFFCGARGYWPCKQVDNISIE